MELLATPFPRPHCCAPLPSLRLCKPGCSWTTGSLCCSAATEPWEREPQRRHPLPHSPSSFPSRGTGVAMAHILRGPEVELRRVRRLHHGEGDDRERERVCRAQLSQAGLLQLDLISYPIPSYWGPEGQHRTMLQGRGTRRPTAGANTTLSCPFVLLPQTVLAQCSTGIL